MVLCPCGNAPSYDPEWQMACCFEWHGVIYRGVLAPERWREAEAILLLRPMAARNWDPAIESIGDLVEDNRTHGLMGVC